MDDEGRFVSPRTFPTSRDMFHCITALSLEHTSCTYTVTHAYRAQARPSFLQSLVMAEQSELAALFLSSPFPLSPRFPQHQTFLSFARQTYETLPPPCDTCKDGSHGVVTQTVASGLWRLQETENFLSPT